MTARSARRAAWRGHQERLTDWVLVMAVLLLTALGLVMAYSTTFFWSQVSEGSPLAIFGRHVSSAGLGLLAFAVFCRLDYGLFRRLAVVIMLGCLIALVGVILFGDEVFGARRTLFNGSVQPSELVKLGVIIYAAAWLASRRDQVRSILNGLLPFGVIIGSVCFLIVIQPDLSTAAVITITALAMFFMAGASWQQLGLVVLIAAGAFALLVVALPYATTRLNEFLKIWQTPAEMSYHIRQSLITLGSGGLFGNGIGASGQKFGYLPPHTPTACWPCWGRTWAGRVDLRAGAVHRVPLARPAHRSARRYCLWRVHRRRHRHMGDRAVVVEPIGDAGDHPVHWHAGAVLERRRIVVICLADGQRGGREHWTRQPTAAS